MIPPLYNPQNNVHSQNSQHIHSLPPPLAAPQPICLPLNPIPSPTPHTPLDQLTPDPMPYAPLPTENLTYAPLPNHHLHCQHLPHTCMDPYYNAPPVINPALTQISYLPSSLPSTKDVPVLTGKHD